MMTKQEAAFRADIKVVLDEYHTYITKECVMVRDYEEGYIDGMKVILDLFNKHFPKGRPSQPTAVRAYGL